MPAKSRTLRARSSRLGNISTTPPVIVRKPVRVLIASHSHPDLTNGGAEIAAFQLFRLIQDRPDCEAWFLGCDRSAARPGAAICQPFSDREFVYSTGQFDWFKFANRDSRFPAEVEELFANLRPDIAHFHHYINFGVEVFQHVKRAVPNCKIALTLHEYLAICNHYGQMVTANNQHLCYKSSLRGCQSCFPEFQQSDFFLRTTYIKRFFSLVDRFVAPSQFLAERYVGWGIPRHKIQMIENVTSADSEPGPLRPISIVGPLKIGFFGQISPLKGINVVFDTAELLIKQQCNDVAFDIYGDYTGQPVEFQDSFIARLAKAGHNVRFYGPYHRRQVSSLMMSVDAIVVPSIWWENSPVVIQEAFLSQRPVICSDIGGMAEKVRDGTDGFHFRAGSAVGLAALLARLTQDRTILSKLAAGMRRPWKPEQRLKAHFQLYQQMLGHNDGDLGGDANGAG